MANTKHKILLTGGAGFIGSHVADIYLKAGFEVLIIDNLATGKKKNIPPQARFYQADICDAAALDKIFAEEKPTLINHHAAQTDVTTSVNNPSHDAKVNIVGGIYLLELSKKYGVQKWIFASTGGALYGEVSRSSAKETTPIHPLSPYGTSKYCLEKYIELYAKLYALPYTILRYANVYGPRQISKAEGGVVSIFVEAMLKEKSPTIYGDGTQQRDFVYVEDIAKANLYAITKGSGEAINIATNKTTNILELFSLLKKELKFTRDSQFATPRPGEIYRSVLDNSQAKKTLEWEPTVFLQEGLQKTIRWQKENN